MAEGYPPEARDAVYKVIAERRDVRQGFRPDPVPPEVLGRVLAAAHQAPSVGFSQPWDFIVITDRARRERVAALAGDIRMNCDVCVYRIAMPGFEHRVGEPQHPHDHPHDHVHDVPRPHPQARVHG